VCDLETSRIGAPYIYDISSLRVNITLWQVMFEIQASCLATDICVITDLFIAA